MLYVRCSPGKQEFIFKEKTPHHGNGAQFTGSLSPHSGFLVSVKWDSEYKVSKELGARKNCGNDAGRICHISVSRRILLLLNKHWTWSWKKKTKPQRKAVYATQGDAFLKACFCGSKRLMLFDLASVNSTQLFSLECSFKHQVEGSSYAWRARDLKTETFK